MADTTLETRDPNEQTTTSKGPRPSSQRKTANDGRNTEQDNTRISTRSPRTKTKDHNKRNSDNNNQHQNNRSHLSSPLGLHVALHPPHHQQRHTAPPNRTILRPDLRTEEKASSHPPSPHRFHVASHLSHHHHRPHRPTDQTTPPTTPSADQTIAPKRGRGAARHHVGLPRAPSSQRHLCRHSIRTCRFAV